MRLPRRGTPVVYYIQAGQTALYKIGLTADLRRGWLTSRPLTPSPCVWRGLLSILMWREEPKGRGPPAPPPDEALKPTPPQDTSEAIGQDIAQCRIPCGHKLLEHFNRIGHGEAHREGLQPGESPLPGEHTRQQLHQTSPGEGESRGSFLEYQVMHQAVIKSAQTTLGQLLSAVVCSLEKWL